MLRVGTYCSLAPCGPGPPFPRALPSYFCFRPSFSFTLANLDAALPLLHGTPPFAPPPLRIRPGAL